MENKITITPDDGSITMEGTGLVQINTKIEMVGTGTELPIKIVADFSNVPHNLHHLYYNSLTYQYSTGVNLYNNTGEDEPKTIEEKKSEWRINRIVDILSNAILKK